MHFGGKCNRLRNFLMYSYVESFHPCQYCKEFHTTLKTAPETNEGGEQSSQTAPETNEHFPERRGAKFN